MHTNALHEALRQSAHAMNEGDGSAEGAIRLLAQFGYLQRGVPAEFGGAGGTLGDAVEAIADVARYCLTSGFVFWCQRVFAEYLVHSPNAVLRESLLPQVLSGDIAGATGLSNAMKHLAGLEPLRTRAVLDGDTLTLDGFLPWASNLRPGRFVLAVAAQVDENRALVAAVPAQAEGVQRGEDLSLLGLQSSQTATVTLKGVRLSRAWLLSDDAHAFLPILRPNFLLLQCGLGMGVARAALEHAHAGVHGAREVLSDRLETLCAREQALTQETRRLALSRVGSGKLLRRLFEVRIEWMRLAVETVHLELEATGGAGFLADSHTARRLREVAFLPVLTPSLTQLAMQLHHTPTQETRTPS